MHGELGQPGIAVDEPLLPDLELREPRALAHEIDAEVELATARTARQHVVHGGDDVARLQVATAKPETGAEEIRHFVAAEREDSRVRRHCTGRQAAIFDSLRHRRPNLPQQRQVHGQRLVGALHHHHTLLASQQRDEQVSRERPEHREVHHADLEPARRAQVIDHGLGVRHHRTLADDHPLCVVRAVALRPRVVASGEGGVFVQRAIGEGRDVVEVERPLRRHALRIAVLVLHHAEHRRVVEVERLRDAAPLVAEHQPLRRRGRFDLVGRIAEVFLDERALGKPQRLDDMTREEPVLGDDPRVQRELGDAVGDEIEVGHFLHVLGEQLKESGVVHGVIVVMAGVHVEGMLGDRPRGHVEHVGEPLAHRRVQRLVHIGDALPTREVGRPEPGHRHAGGHCRGRVLSLGLEEQQAPPIHIALAFGHGDRPSLAHLRRGRDRVRARGFTGRRFHRHHGAAAVERLERAGVPVREEGDRSDGLRFRRREQLHGIALPEVAGTRANCAPESHTMAFVGHRSTAAGVARAISS